MIEKRNGYLKFEIVKFIKQVYSDRKLTQVQLAEIINLDQPKVARLLSCKQHLAIYGFSLERLFRFLNLLGYDVKVEVCKSKSKEGDLFFIYEEGGKDA